MELSKRLIHLFLELQKVVISETTTIFQPILDEVERQGQKVLLFPPVESTTWVEWVIKKPKGDIFAFHHHLFIVIQPGQGTDNLYLTLVGRFGGIRNNYTEGFNREVFKELYRAGGKRPGWFSNMPEWLDEEDEWRDGPYDSIYSDEGIEELVSFPLKRDIKPEVIAERIVAQAKKIYKFMTINANDRQKDCAKRRARARQRQALVPEPPTPTN